MIAAPYHRVLLKISGESLSSISPKVTSSTPQGIDQEMLEKIATDIKAVHSLGVQITIVVGGGNIYRGVKGSKLHGIDRPTSDYMGMLATIINAMALQSVIESFNLPCCVLSAIPIPAITEEYIRRKAIRHLEKGRVVIFAAGTGNPFFTTDTTAALRAAEMGCDLLLKATKVAGVYANDPEQDPYATFFPTLTYNEVLFQKLGVMDATAIALSRENHIPIAIFSIYGQESFKEVIEGKGQFTLIR